jgi:hypothetical protein
MASSLPCSLPWRSRSWRSFLPRRQGQGGPGLLPLSLPQGGMWSATASTMPPRTPMPRAMPRPTKLTPARHARIVELLHDGVPFATACKRVGVSPSAGYDWLYRAGARIRRAPKPAYVRFAQAVDAVFPGGFTERYEDEFVDVQSSEGTESGRDRENGGKTVERPLRRGFRSSRSRLRARARPSLRRSQSRRNPTLHAIARARVKRTATRNPDTQRCRG